MKAVIHFIDSTTAPITLHGGRLGMYEIGVYTNIKDYNKEGNKVIASIVTDKVLYIEYKDDLE